MSKKNSKPQQSKLGGEVVDLANLRVA